MAITGQLAEFSLPELFQFLEQGKKTGRLAIETSMDPSADASAKQFSAKQFYVWFRQGRIVAASSRADGHGLLLLMHRQGWLKGISSQEAKQFQALVVPIGVYLKIRNVLSPEQLKLLFYHQVMRQVCALFELREGRFEFESKADMPMQEMTGQMMQPTEVTLGALRVLKDWRALAEKLPEAEASLESVLEGQPQLRLNRAEWQIWEFANGTISLRNIAEQLRMPLEEVRQVAFRLIVVGLAEEIPALAGAGQLGGELSRAGSEADDLSPTFLQSLVEFLKGNA